MADKKDIEESYHASLHTRRYLNTIQGSDPRAAEANGLFAELVLSAPDDDAGCPILNLLRYAFVAGVNSGLPPRLPVGGN